jgi:hypothetical protein
MRVDVKSDSHITNEILNVLIQEASPEKSIGIIAEQIITSGIRIAI